ncbi:MAG TPA: DUF1961 family protein [Opitutaceae bacterium]|nr:DUF1961 family protein [Opitutaceae bacterium]
MSRALDVDRRSFLRAAGIAAAGAWLGAIPARAVAPAALDREETALRGSDPDRLGPFALGRPLQRNALASAGDVRGFRLEGQAQISFPEGRLRLANALDPALGQKSNFVYWFDRELPEDFAAGWDFWPIRDPGLCMVFFGARARRGGDIFAPGLKARTGEYAQYHHGEIDTLHLSYFRRSRPMERDFQVCNLRKSYGFHLVAEGADPLPPVREAAPPYRVELVKCGAEVAFFIDRLPVLRWTDDGRAYGPVLGAGRFGFRQMAPLIAEYGNFTVREVRRA